jgi:hypothetical protein
VARSEARVLVDIWDDEDFLALSPAAQRMFLFLISQRDLEHTGVLALRERRWAKGARGMTSEDIVRDLKELALARFVLVDEEAEELLVRSFIRRDKVFKQPNVMRSAVERVSTIRSRRVREELLVELHRIVETEDMSESARAIVEEMREGLAKACGNPSRNPSTEGSTEASGNGSPKGSEHRPGEWGMGKEEELNVQDQNSDGSEEAKDTTTAAKTPRRSTKEGKLPSSHPDLAWTDKEIDTDPAWIAFWAAYPKSADKPPARKAWLKALREKEITADELVIGAGMYRDDPRRSAGYTKNAATWLNAESWNNYQSETVEPEQDPEAFWLN